MRIDRRALAAWLGAAALAGCLPAAELAGRIVLTQSGKPASDRTLDLHEAVVFFEPAAEAKGARPKSAAPPPTVEMATFKKEFTPRVVVVPVGGSVRFPNQDRILHNVFSFSGGNHFDLGLVGRGTGKVVRFTEPGLVRVFCNVHHQMYGSIWVVATPYFTQPDAHGAFALRDLPDGPGKLSVWHERGELQTMDVTLPREAPLAVEVAITQPRIPPHKNKFGESYSAQPSYE